MCTGSQDRPREPAPDEPGGPDAVCVTDRPAPHRYRAAPPPSHRPAPMLPTVRPHRGVVPTTALAGALALALAGCGGGADGSGPTGSNPAPTGDFELFTGGVGTLVEGAENALYVPLTLARAPGAAPETVRLTALGATEADAAGLAATFTDPELEGGEVDSGLLLELPVGALPIRAHTRRLTLVAEGPSGVDRLEIDVAVDPTDAPDVYLLAGQSNMVGFSGDGTRQPDGADASDPRILQLNVTPNDSTGEDAPFDEPSDFAAYEANVRTPPIVVAEDPLHTPAADDGDEGKDGQYIGLGLSFAKRALGRTDAEVVLVPAAWSGSAFCANDGGPVGQWMPGPPEGDEAAAVLGNTLLFERAVARANAALAETGGVLRGILWHQGESDANERCAPFYAGNVARLARELRSRIAPDRRGPAWRGPDANVPFVVGTLSRGADERGDLSTFSAAKRTVDDALRALPFSLAHSAVSIHDDLVPAAGFPCGNDSCIHFGAQALREMGVRYDEALELAARAPAVGAAAGPTPSGAE